MRFSYTYFLKGVFINVVLNAIYSGNGLKVIGEFIPNTRPYVR